MSGHPLTRSAVFMALTLLLSLPFYVGIISAGNLGAGFGLLVTGWLWSPALAAILTCRLYRQPFATDAWRWGHPRYLLLAYLLAPGYLLVAYLPVWLFGLGRFYDTSFANKVVASFAWTGVSPRFALGCYVVLQATVGFVRASTSALGEEIGWRGFLVPELAKTWSFAGVSVMTGVATALWAFPVIPATTRQMATPLWYRLVCFTALVIGINFVFTWLRLRSESLWPCVILHGSHNVFVERLFTPFTADTGRTSYFVDEFGVAIAVAVAVLAFAFWTKRALLFSGSSAPRP